MLTADVAVLLPAAGQGERLGQGPKALLKLAELSLLQIAVRSLQQVGGQVLIAAPAGLEDTFRSQVPGARVITGGSSRQETVRLLVGHTAAELVLVHDAARPFLPVSVAERVVTAAAEHGAATAGLPVADTIVNRHTGAAVDREELRAVQTPQGFRRALLARAHAEAAATGRTASDDAALVRNLGHEVVLVPGSPWLFKITHPADLSLARALAGRWLEHRDAV